MILIDYKIYQMIFPLRLLFQDHLLIKKLSAKIENLLLLISLSSVGQQDCPQSNRMQPLGKWYTANFIDKYNLILFTFLIFESSTNSPFIFFTYGICDPLFSSTLWVKGVILFKDAPQFSHRIGDFCKTPLWHILLLNYDNFF